MILIWVLIRVAQCISVTDTAELAPPGFGCRKYSVGKGKALCFFLNAVIIRHENRRR